LIKYRFVSEHQIRMDPAVIPLLPKRKSTAINVRKVSGAKRAFLNEWWIG